MDVGKSYREAAVRGASPVELVVRLYEQAIEDLRQALKGLEQNDVELRSNKMNHAILVLGYLQSQIEFQNGGKVAKDLEKFYNALRENLVHAQITGSKPLLLQQITDLLTVREAWIEVHRAERGASAIPAVPEETSSEAAQQHVDWKG